MKDLIVYEPNDLVQILKLSRATINEMLHRGELPAVRVRQGKSKTTFRVYGDALARWMEQNTVRPAG